MSCRLEVHCGRTNMGQVLAAVGASPELGCWDLGKAVKLETRDEIFPIWEGMLQPAFLGTEFKFVILGPADNAIWEALPNRCWPQEKAASAIYGGVLCTSFDEADLQIKEQEQQSSGGSYDVSTEAPCCSSECSSQGYDHACKMPPARSVRFKATVSVSEMPHYGGSDLQDRLWYSEADYKEFLQLRLALSKEYKHAVRQKRVRPSGSFDILDPLLSEESTRGFGFHRTKLRQNNTHDYITAVLNEQARQLQDAKGRPGFVLDDVELSKAAFRISESDVLYSIERAQKEYLADCETSPTMGKSQHVPKKEDILQMAHPGQESTSQHHEPTDDVSDGMLRVPSIPLMDRSEEDDELRHSSGPSAKGFGLPRDVLQEHGLRATGRKDDAVQRDGMEGHHDAGD
eukprot:TRINITY_DN58807_c0_g1_i1.p2 TRINITY_DN58807_c0_g1~~TRINITY_DN58807_c0_g1_i1.p2  ORF type:complete len:401 (-),score=67.65 TRINITY_DN58807_c0_g1_i1:359-1561(-)